MSLMILILKTLYKTATIITVTITVTKRSKKQSSHLLKKTFPGASHICQNCLTQVSKSLTSLLHKYLF